MDEYVVVPWDHLGVDPETGAPIETGIVLEQYVPPELEALAYKVMEQYDMTVSDMRLITSKPDKGGAIWRIETNMGPRSIKVLHRTPQRSLFSVGAQQHLVQQGARVPALIPTRDEALFVEAGGKMWIVTDWIDTLIPASKIDLEGAAALCQGLGEFHQWSKDYIPPHGAAKSSRLFGWPKSYQKMIAKIGWFRHIAEAYPETAGSSPLLQMVDEFERQGIEMLEKLNNSAYPAMVMMGETYWGLAHQDYGWSNGQMGPGGIWVIDLDGVAYDLPFRDLRKLITSTMTDMGTWDITWIRGMIEAYNRGNPLTQEMFDILWIDMAFPGEFYKHVKEIVFDPVNFMELELPAILQLVEATEMNKWQVLQELQQDRELYPPGNYVAELENTPLLIDVPDSSQLNGYTADLNLFAAEADIDDPNTSVPDPDPVQYLIQDPAQDPTLDSLQDPILDPSITFSDPLDPALIEDPPSIDSELIDSSDYQQPIPQIKRRDPINHHKLRKRRKQRKPRKPLRRKSSSASSKRKSSSTNKLSKTARSRKQILQRRKSRAAANSKTATRKSAQRPASSKSRNSTNRSRSVTKRTQSNRKMA